MTDVDDRPGAARSSGIPYRDLLAREKSPVPECLKVSSEPYLGSEDIPKEQYYSQNFFDLEVTKMWRKVWQVACRQEDIPRVGDSFVYEIAGISILVVRTEPQRVKAYYNACLHRGRQLRSDDGYIPEIRCPFHGFSWELDGTLKSVATCPWDFPHVDPDAWRLPEVRVDTWGGFIFLNMDASAPPLAEYLGDFPKIWDDQWRPLEEYIKIHHTRQVVRCNWKATIEAFMESMHVQATHPQIAAYTGDGNAQIDVWRDTNYSRMITPFGTPSPELPWQPSEQDVLDFYLESRSQVMMGVELSQGMKVPPGKTAREVIGDAARAQLREKMGDAALRLTDTELLDNHQHYIFPNFEPHGVAPGMATVYLVRPYGTDPEMSIFDMMVLARVPEGEPRPAAVKPKPLGDDDMSPLNQDWVNLQWVQRGLKFSVKPGITLGNYTESRIRHLHELLDRYISA